MPKFNISPSEWDVANQLLKAEDNPWVKLYRSDKFNNLPTIYNRYSNFTRYHTNHSFIKVGSYLLAFNPSSKSKNEDAKYYYDKQHVAIGRGTYGTVKYAMAQDNNLYAVKIQHQKEYLKEAAADSFWTAFDINLAFCYQYRNNDIIDYKAYTVMRYLGHSVSDYIDNNPPTAARFDLAAKMAFQVHKYHSGMASKTSQKYAHGDIKDSNFTIDEKGLVSLVDVDMVTKGIEDKPSVIGTHVFLPKDPYNTSKKKLDCLALKRAFYYPEQALHYVNSAKEKNEAKNQPYNLQGVFTLQQLKASGLAKYIDTTSFDNDFIDDYISPLDLTVLISLATIGAVDDFDKIKTETQKNAIAILMHAGCFNSDNLLKIITNKFQYDKFSLLVPIVDRLPASLIVLAVRDSSILEKLIMLAEIPAFKRRDFVAKFVKYYLDHPHNIQGLLTYCFYPTKRNVQSKFKLAFATNNINNINDNDLLCQAVIYGLEDELAQALKLGASPNIKDIDGYTPFMLAVIFGNNKFVRILNDYPLLDKKIKQKDGYDAYDFAAFYSAKYPSLFDWLKLNSKEYTSSRNTIIDCVFMGTDNTVELNKKFYFVDNMLIGRPAKLNLSVILPISLYWLSEVCENLKFDEQTYFRAASMFYQIISLKSNTMTRKDIQKYLCSCCIIANYIEKPDIIYEELSYELARLSDHAYTRLEINNAVLDVLKTLDMTLLNIKNIYTSYSENLFKNLSAEQNKLFTAHLTFISFDFRFLKFNNDLVLNALNQCLFNPPQNISLLNGTTQYQECLAMIKSLIKEIPFKVPSDKQMQPERHYSIKGFSVTDVMAKKFIKNPPKIELFANKYRGSFFETKKVLRDSDVATLNRTKKL